MKPSGRGEGELRGMTSEPGSRSNGVAKFQRRYQDNCPPSESDGGMIARYTAWFGVVWYGRWVSSDM